MPQMTLYNNRHKIPIKPHPKTVKKPLPPKEMIV